MLTYKRPLSKQVLYLIVLALMVMLLSSCNQGSAGGDPQTEPISNDDSSTNSSLAETLISEIGTDLSSNNFEQTDIDSIQSQARTTVSAANVSNSSDIGEVAPQVLKGSFLGVSVLDNYGHKIQALDIITGYIAKSLTNSASRSISGDRANSISNRTNAVLYNTSSSGYSTILEEIMEIAIQNLDEAGISSLYMPLAIKTVVMQIDSSLNEAGISSMDYAVIIKNLTTVAISSLDEAGVDASTRKEAIKSVLSGSLKGMNKLGLGSSDIAALADEVMEGSVLGLNKAGVADDDLDSWITIIKSGLNKGLTESGLTDAEIVGVQAGIDTAARKGKNILVVVVTVTAGETNSAPVANAGTDQSLSPAKAVTSFSFTAVTNSALSADVTAAISGFTISATVPYETDITALVANFTTNGSSVKIGSTTQNSGTTSNNFTSSVTYTVVADDDSTRNYTVTVNIADDTTTWNFVDGNGDDGINNDPVNNDAERPQLTVFDSKLYATWQENVSKKKQIRVKKYEGGTWSSVDGNGANGIDKVTGNDAERPQLTVFDSKLYATWQENASKKQIRVVVYNGNDSFPAWNFVDGNGADGINNDPVNNDAERPQLTVFDSKLYATWQENVSKKKQIRVVVYNGNDSSPAWNFVDGNGASGINKDPGNDAERPKLTVFDTLYDSKLYATWQEKNGKKQIRVVVYNGNDSSPAWNFVDGDGANGINKDTGNDAERPQLTVFDSKLYACWQENVSKKKQIRVVVYNGNDSSPAWNFVDGDGANGINKVTGNDAERPQLTVFDSKLYATWQEKASKKKQIRMVVYNGNDSSPAWNFVDGDGANGINKDIGNDAERSQLTVFDSELYATWQEKASKKQIRVVKKE